MANFGGLTELNSAPRNVAFCMLEPMVEKSPWVAKHVLDLRPFASADDIAQKLVDVILEAGYEKRFALFRVHPELGGCEAIAGTMTQASTSEQGRLGLTSLTEREAARLASMNAAYAKRFGYPFILALHRIPDRAAVFDIFERRLAASAVEEHVSTLAEIASVIAARVAQVFEHAPTAQSAEIAGG